MGTSEDTQLERLGAILSAPDVGRGHPEELFGGEGEGGQDWLLPVVGGPLKVGVIGLLDATIVSDVLSLGVHAVQRQVNLWSSVVAVLVNYALGLLDELGPGLWEPPLL